MLCRVLCVLFFLAWTAEAANDTVIYCGLWRSPFEIAAPLFASIPGIGLFPWQILLLLLTPLCLLRPGAFRFRSGIMDAALGTSLASIVLTFLWGFMRGGSAYNAYYQLWRFLLALLVGLLLLSVVRRPRDLRALGFTVLLAAVVRGGLVIYFYWAHVHGKLDPPPIYMTTHDDTLLFVAGLLVMLGWALAQMKATTWAATVVVSIHLLYAIALNNRRLAWIELMLAVAAVYALLPRGGVRRRVNRFLLVAAPVVLLYVVVGWGRQGAFFEPLRALSTSGSNEDASSLARLEEIRNLMYTLAAAGNPLLGTGWGVPYQQVTTVYTHFGEDWWQYQYMPHNSLLGVVVFGGLVGIFGIWIVVPVTAFLATRGHRGSPGPVERAAAMAAVGVLPAYGAQCYGDLGFQSFTCGLLLGVAIAVAGKVSAWAAASPESAEPPAGPSASEPEPLWPYHLADG
jgi:hypothetical protein